MKVIKVKTITPPQNSKVFSNLNKYSIFVDWGLTIRFSNKKDAESYQNALNDWLNEMIYKVNEQLILVTVHYRRLWLFYDFDNSEERKITKEISQVENCLNQCFRYQSPGSGFSNIFRMVTMSIDCLLNCYNYIEKKQRSRNNWEAIKLISYERNLLRLLLQEAKEWPNLKYQELTGSSIN